MRNEPITGEHYWQWMSAPIVEHVGVLEEIGETQILHLPQLNHWGGMITWTPKKRWYSYVVLP